MSSGFCLQRHGGVLGGFGPIVPEQVNPGPGAAGLHVTRIKADRLVCVGESIVELAEIPAGARTQHQEIDPCGLYCEAAGGVGDNPGPVSLFGEKAGAAQAELDLERIEPDGLAEIGGCAGWVVQFEPDLAAGMPKRRVLRLRLQRGGLRAQFLIEGRGSSR